MPLCIVLVVCLAALFAPAASPDTVPAGLQGPVGDTLIASSNQSTFQGKDVRWWARHAQQARRDANARAQTIKMLRAELRHSPSVQEAVALASMVYPEMPQCSAWAIIRHESGGNPNAKNPSSTASGLYQFLTSTFASTPYGRAGFSIWSPYASSLAAGWMHRAGRGSEWAIRRC